MSPTVSLERRHSAHALSDPFLDVPLLEKQLIVWLVRAWHLLGGQALKGRATGLKGDVHSWLYSPFWFLHLALAAKWLAYLTPGEWNRKLCLGFLACHMFHPSSILPWRSPAYWGLTVTCLLCIVGCHVVSPPATVLRGLTPLVERPARRVRGSDRIRAQNFTGSS